MQRRIGASVHLELEVRPDEILPNQIVCDDVFVVGVERDGGGGEELVVENLRVYHF